MRQVTSTVLAANGQTLQVSLIEAPNVDDVISTEAQVMAYAIATGQDISSRRVGRAVRELILRFGVQR